MIPGDFIHLCQPGEEKSCGACCGLYNYADSRRDSLDARLTERTRLFRETVRGRDDLPAYADRIRQAEDPGKRYEVIYCCEYLGYIDSGRKKVGCLLHPCQNGGEDLRDVSFYGRELCDGHFCPSYHYLSRQESEALVRIIEDWYLYGLCVTDIDLVKNWFRLVAEAVHEMPRAEKFSEGPLKKISLQFFSLKLVWPYRSRETNRFGKYYFDGSQYMIKPIDYTAFGIEVSRFDKIFQSLASEFHHRSEVLAAETKIQEYIDRFAACYTRGADPKF
ncbi:MAG TPA: hypothetical protein PK425_10400 [Syntrophales bacterium]|jgi:hypothetical protein|nr:hypothetical protein [Syntrophales bacterium]HPX56935.1 hypothetical protein [Syntrophales bacterium]